MVAYRLDDIAQRFGLELDGDSNLTIEGLCGLTDDLPRHLSFIANTRYLTTAEQSRIPAFVTRPQHQVPGKSCLFHPQPEYAIARIAALFVRSQLAQTGRVHPTAVVSPTATLASDVEVGALAVIGEQVRIGARSRIMAGTIIMDRVAIGEDCVVFPNCVVREDSILKNRVILQPGAIIGGDGFGFVMHEGQHVKIPQLGNVVLDDDVEVGANTTIDRGRFTETYVGRGSKIDNQVMLGHNVKTGEQCIIVSQVGISGSTKLGDRVVIAGQAGLAGHIEIASDVTILGQAMVSKSIREAGLWGGAPIRPAKIWRKAMARLYKDLDHEKGSDD